MERARTDPRGTFCEVSTKRILRAADAAMCKVKTGDQAFPYLATRADAYADTVNGRRAGRPGTHLPAA
ncbi:hypothetical protein [Streptomyces sp. NPDC056165]|uniref:hypothetical protein n=1 Tax=Streptomyces sp. NPDC056165 TaxID=3345733 RepID=UPI0035E1E1A8